MRIHRKQPYHEIAFVAQATDHTVAIIVAVMMKIEGCFVAVIVAVIEIDGCFVAAIVAGIEIEGSVVAVIVVSLLPQYWTHQS